MRMLYVSGPVAAELFGLCHRPTDGPLPAAARGRGAGIPRSGDVPPAGPWWGCAMLSRFALSEEHRVADGGLPAGTVTFVLADVVGSARLWEKHAEVMPAVLARLEDLLEGWTIGNGGVRPVEQ